MLCFIGFNNNNLELSIISALILKFLVLLYLNKLLIINYGKLNDNYPLLFKTLNIILLLLIIINLLIIVKIIVIFLYLKLQALISSKLNRLFFGSEGGGSPRPSSPRPSSPRPSSPRPGSPGGGGGGRGLGSLIHNNNSSSRDNNDSSQQPEHPSVQRLLLYEGETLREAGVSVLGKNQKLTPERLANMDETNKLMNLFYRSSLNVFDFERTTDKTKITHTFIKKFAKFIDSNKKN